MSDVGHEEPFDDGDQNGLREVSATALAVLELLDAVTARRPLSASQAEALADHLESLNQRALAPELNAHLVRTRALYAAPLTWKKRHSRVGYLPSTHQTWRAEVKLVGHAISERRLRSIAGRSARAFRKRLNDGSHHPLSSEVPLAELVRRLRLHELLTDPLLDESEDAPKVTRQKLPARCYKRRAAIRRSDVPLLEALVVLCTNGASPTPDVFDLSYSLAVGQSV